MKLLAFAAALMPDPELLLLDEPAAAINPTMIEQMKAQQVQDEQHDVPDVHARDHAPYEIGIRLEKQWPWT